MSSMCWSSAAFTVRSGYIPGGQVERMRAADRSPRFGDALGPSVRQRRTRRPLTSRGARPVPSREFDAWLTSTPTSSAPDTLQSPPSTTAWRKSPRCGDSFSTPAGPVTALPDGSERSRGSRSPLRTCRGAHATNARELVYSVRYSCPRCWASVITDFCPARAVRREVARFCCA